MPFWLSKRSPGRMDEDYNMQIVRDGDALPPNPKYVETDAFKRPPDYPNEWGCHEVHSEAAQTIAITQRFTELGVEAPIWQGAKMQEYGHIARFRNAARRDGSAAKM